MISNNSTLTKMLFEKIDLLSEENTKQTGILEKLLQQNNLIYTFLNDQKKESLSAIFEINCRRLGITAKEKEIITMIKQGYTQKQISRKLFISGSTVNTHIQNIYAKAGVHSNVQMLEKVYTLADTTVSA